MITVNELQRLQNDNAYQEELIKQLRATIVELEAQRDTWETVAVALGRGGLVVNEYANEGEQKRYYPSNE